MKLTTAELQEHIRVRLETRKGEFIHQPSLGSDLWRLGRAKNAADMLRFADKAIREALAPEIDAGNIDKIQRIEITEQSITGFKLRVVIFAAQEKLEVNYDSSQSRVIPQVPTVC